MRTYYQAILESKNAGLWADNMVMFDRAWTLDFYFRLYQLVLEYYPDKPYGYAAKMVRNPLIISQMGGGIRSIEKTLIPSNLSRSAKLSNSWRRLANSKPCQP